MCPEYSPTFNGQTPDWYDDKEKLVVEVFTCERGGTSHPVQRVAKKITEKVAKYRQLIAARSLRYIVAVHGDFICGFDKEDCEDAIKAGNLFTDNLDLGGILFFGETHLIRVKREDGTTRRKQVYGFKYFERPTSEAVQR